MYAGSHKDPKRILDILYLAKENIRSLSPEVTSGNGSGELTLDPLYQPLNCCSISLVPSKIKICET